MNYLDIIFILFFVTIVFLGSKRNPFEQISASVAALGSLLIAALAYGRLAFLIQGSGHRSLILALLIGAIGFLSYDLLLSLARRLKKRFMQKKLSTKASIENRALSGIVAGCTAIVLVWLAAGVFEGSSSATIQTQLQSSRIVGLLENARPVPKLFKEVASLLAPFSAPRVFAGNEPTFSNIQAVGTGFDKLDAATAIVTKAMAKVSTQGCGTSSIGSGFFVDERTVITNAHVIAGADRVSVETGDNNFVAQVIWFDPKLDLAVLSMATDATKSFLTLYNGLLGNGTITGILGYPNGQSLMTGDSVILQALDAQGYDIYGQEKTLRKVYAIRSTVVPGNSGGPLINSDGEVVGLIFGHSTTQQKTGYAITSTQIAPAIKSAQSQRTTVSNGSCAAPQ